MQTLVFTERNGCRSYFKVKSAEVNTVLQVLSFVYLLAVLLLQCDHLLGLVVHLILQSVLLSVQGGDGPVERGRLLFVSGAVLTQLACWRGTNVKTEVHTKNTVVLCSRHSPILTSRLSICSRAACSSFIFTDSLRWASDSDFSIWSCSSLQKDGGGRRVFITHLATAHQRNGMKIRSTQTSRRWTPPSSGRPPQRCGSERQSERSAPPSRRRRTPSAGAPESAGPAARAPTTQPGAKHRQRAAGENAAAETLFDNKLTDECLRSQSSRHCRAPGSVSAPLVCQRAQMSERPAERRTDVENVYFHFNGNVFNH